MTTTKQEFVKTFLPESVRNISFAQIDLDITDLSLADVLRNVNRTFPENSRTRNAIISGQFAVGILCKTELLYPLSGILLIVTGDDIEIEIVSKNYVVIGVSEDRIKTNDDIRHVLDSITKYLIVSFRNSILKFNEFYSKFVYDPYELEVEELDDDYINQIYARYIS